LGVNDDWFFGVVKVLVVCVVSFEICFLKNILLRRGLFLLGKTELKCSKSNIFGLFFCNYLIFSF